jgi:hypothetical protein
MLSCGAAKDQLVVVARKTHRIGGQPAVSFADIVDEAFVGLSDAALGVHLGERASRLRRPQLAVVPLSEPWALRQLHLCAWDFSALTPHANLLARQLMASSSMHASGELG